MSNKTSDENVANIKDDLKILEEFAEICKAGLACYDQTKEGEALERILAEREQKDKRIKELEEELEKANRQLDLDYVDENFIPKQVVINTINENEFEVYTREYGNVEVVSIDVLQELLEGVKNNANIKS